MDMKQVTTWVEAHPGESVIIGGGGLLLLLWLLGFFSSSATQAAPSQDPLAAAYYAAEAQQAVVGGQIQMNNADNAAATAQAGINANAATAIASTNATAAQTINGQNADAAQTINQQTVSGASTIAGIEGGVYTALGSDQLQATYSNNGAALAAVQSNNATAQTIDAANNAASEFNTYATTIAPVQMSYLKGGSFVAALPSGQYFSETGAPPPQGTPAWYNYVGYSPSDANRLAVPQGTY